MDKEMKLKEYLLCKAAIERKKYYMYKRMNIEANEFMCYGRHKTYWHTYKIFCIHYGGSRMLRDRGKE